MECLSSTGSNIEPKLRMNYTSLTENVSECELKLERQLIKSYLLDYYKTLIALCQNKEIAIRHHNNDIDDPVY